MFFVIHATIIPPNSGAVTWKMLASLDSLWQNIFNPALARAFLKREWADGVCAYPYFQSQLGSFI